MLKQKLYKFLCLLTLPLVMGLFYNQASNWHLHKLENGIIIEHAHPFERSTGTTPFQNHHHSGQELVFLALISNVLITIVLVFFVLAIAAVLLPQKIKTLPSIIVSVPAFPANLLRAPPLKVITVLG